MGRDRRQSPRLEALEGKQLLSTVHFNHIVAPGRGTLPILNGGRPPVPLVLNGTLKGDVSTYTDTPGPPETMTEAFSGQTRAMGRVKAVVVDQIDAKGNLIGGQVVLTNARGSVTLGFGPDSTISGQQAGSITIQVVRYSVVSGTGAYAHRSGVGTFTAIQDTGTYTAARSSGMSSTLVLESTSA
ncbi:MAG TPA: hypothetical protein VGH33_12710 [Isosphaeraceae bacterium]|jgi:hypothetical protein